MNALDLLRKALILTFEGAGLGIGPKTWKDRPWPKWVWIFGNIRVLRKYKDKLKKISFWDWVFLVWKMFPDPVGVF